MEPESSLPHSQMSATSPYPEPAGSSPYSHIPLPEIHLNIILPSKPGSLKRSLSLMFPHQNPVYAALLPHTRYIPGPSTRIYHTILGEKYRSLSSSLCSFLHSPVTSQPVNAVQGNYHYSFLESYET